MDTGIKFIIGSKTYHTYSNFGLRQLADLEISPPEPKLHIIEDIPGSDGVIDLTEHFGVIRYKNRTITANFEAQDQSYDEWCTICSNVHNALHGQVAQIIMDIDPKYYWEGRLTVTPTKDAIVYSEIEISMDIFPYKKKILDTVIETSINQNNKTVTVTNSRMPSQPVITVSSAVSLSFDGETYSLKSGDNSPDFELLEGENVLTFTGQTTSVIVKWKEGSL